VVRTRAREASAAIGGAIDSALAAFRPDGSPEDDVRYVVVKVA
jgi:hypothetical protein